MKAPILWLLAAMVVISSETIAQNWQWVTPMAYVNCLNDITFADELRGWAVGDSGSVKRSVDGGETWNEVLIPDAGIAQLKRVRFSDVDHGWILGQVDWSGSNRTIVLRTTDGGSSWHFETHPYFEWVQDFAFPNDHLCLFIGYEAISPNRSFVLRSTDGGATWDSTNAGPMAIHPAIISFPDSLRGWICGGTPDLLQTTDGGITWALQTTGDTASITCMRFLDSLEGWASTSNRRLLHTTDGGNIWSPINTGFGATTFHFADRLNGWGISQDLVTHTTDGGYGWMYSNHEAKELYQVADHSVWSAGRSGAVYRSMDGGTWIKKTGSYIVPTSYSAICFPDTNNGWMLASARWNYGQSEILHSTDGGSSWSFQYVTDTLDLNYLSFPSAMVGYAQSSSGALIKTTNGGYSWTTIYFPAPSESGTGLSFENANCGWFTTFTDYIHFPGGTLFGHTTNGGASWEFAERDGTMPLYDLTFTPDGGGWILGYYYVIHIVNDGEQWLTSMWPNLIWQLGSLSAVGRNYCWITDYGDSLITTTNGGATWTPIPNAGDRWIGSPHFCDSLNGWAQGDGNLLRSTDGGWTWNPDSLMVTCGITSWTSIDTAHIWASTYSNRILRYVPSQPSHVHEEQVSPSSFRMSCYPNPFNPSTEISFTVPVTGRVIISVYDVTGRKVRTLTDDVYSQGDHCTTFDGADLASGLYFVRLDAHGLSNTRKVILLK